LNPQELRIKRAKLASDARAILDKAKAEKRSLSAEENQQYDAIFTEIDSLKDRIDAIEADERREKAIKQVEEELAKPEGRTVPPAPTANDPEQRLRFNATPEYRAAFSSYLRGGFNEMSANEHRALQADGATVGGYLVTPQQFVDDIIQGVDNIVFVRTLATKFSVPNAASLGVPTMDTDVGDPTWTAEILTGSADTSLAFGKRELAPKPLARRILISNKLLRQVAKVENFVRDRFTYKFGTVEENAFLNGSGANEPLGLFTASAMGVSTGRDVSTGNTTTAMTADGLINALYTLKVQYQTSPAVAWCFHRDGMKMIRKFKTGEGDYLWKPGLDAGAPDTILGKRVFVSEYAPNTFTTGLYVGLLGDFSHYWIADALDMTVQRLVELYAATNQTGLIARREVDGMPVLEEAFVRVKLG
jgi:HK97 family phage major capsid protein